MSRAAMIVRPFRHRPVRPTFRFRNFYAITSTAAPKFDSGEWLKLSGTDLTERWLSIEPEGSALHVCLDSGELHTITVSPGMIVLVSQAAADEYFLSIPRSDVQSTIVSMDDLE